MKRKRKKPSRARIICRRLAIALVAALVLLAAAGDWYVHHPRTWLEATEARWPGFVTATLRTVGNPVGEITDAFALTGEDAVYEYDEQPPAGEVFFAGTPRRTGSPAPEDVTILNRGEFAIGWSPSLGHPVWCAYHLTPEAVHDDGKRPSFRKDPAAQGSPAASVYERSGYDRGHMVPNHAIVTRYGEEEQRKTFLMSNIAPQTPALNRGVWRNLEHRISDLWTRRYGEIWVIVGAIPAQNGNGRETLSGSKVEVPARFYQIVVAQEQLDVRAFAVVFDQSVAWDAWPTRHLVSIDELERQTGLDFFPDLPDFIQSPLEAQLPTRLWPIRARDIFKLIALRFR